MILAFVALVLALPATQDRDPYAAIRFSAEPMLSNIVTEVTVDHMRIEDGKHNYRFRKVVFRGHVRQKPLWADTKTCPGARAALEELVTLTPPAISVPGYDRADGGWSTRDGVGYELEAETRTPYGDGRVILRSNTNTPLAKWIEDTLAKLQPCWSDKRPDGLGD